MTTLRSLIICLALVFSVNAQAAPPPVNAAFDKLNVALGQLQRVGSGEPRKHLNAASAALDSATASLELVKGSNAGRMNVLKMINQAQQEISAASAADPRHVNRAIGLVQSAINEVGAVR